MEIFRKAGGNVVNGSFFSWRNICYSLQIECNEITYEKNFRQVQPLGGFLFLILLFFKKGFGLKKKMLLSERVFYFIKWLEFFSSNSLWNQCTCRRFHDLFSLVERNALRGPFVLTFFAKVDLLSFLGWVFSKMDKEKKSSTIDLFFSIEIKSEPGFRSLRREKSVKGWVYVFLLFDLV